MTTKISRRDFLKIISIGAGASILAGCANPRRWVMLEPYVRAPEDQLAGVATWYASTCRQCPAGCGIIVRIMNGRALKIEGNPQHPLNQGKLCARGQAALQTLYDPDRLTGPVVQASRGSRSFSPVSWEEGINTLFARLQAAGSKVAVWGGSTMSGHLYDIFARFTSAVGAPQPIVYDLLQEMTGYVSLSGVNAALFGKSNLPVYDIGNADLIISFNADLLGAGISQVRNGIEFGNFRSRSLGKRGYLVQLEPRMTQTGAKADLWLPIRPGREGLVAPAMIRIIAEQSLGTPDRITKARSFANPVDLAGAASAADITIDGLTNLARIFAESEHPLAIPGGSLGGSAQGTTAITAVQALNAISGTIGQAGGLSLTPDNPLPDTIKKPVQSSLADVVKLIQKMNAGEVQVLMVHGANPAYDLPKIAGFKEALAKVPFIVSFASLVDETAVEADMILPDRTALEGWGYEVVSPALGVPIVASQQPVVTPVFDARATADILLTAAKGIPAAAQALPWGDEVSLLKDAVTKLPPEAQLAEAGSEELWARYLQSGGWWPETPVNSPAGTTPEPELAQLTAPQYQGDASQYPYILVPYISGLLSDGRGANQPWLQGSPDPMTSDSWQTLVEINPDTAKKIGVKDGDVVKVSSPFGEIEGYIYTYPAMRQDVLAIATGQGHSDYGRYAAQRGSHPVDLLSTVTDTQSGSLAWANMRVKITPTGKNTRLALFEWKSGVEEGFKNQALPGQ